MSDLDVRREAPRSVAEAPGRVRLTKTAFTGRHSAKRRRSRCARLSGLVALANRDRTLVGRELRDDRIRRLRVLVGSIVGTVGLLAAYWQRPDTYDLFAYPADVRGWVSLLCGLAGIWLVPGLWFAACVARVGAGLTAWLATRVGITLMWYVLVSAAINEFGQGAKVTTLGILIATIGATAAIALGIALGLSQRPGRPWLRMVLPAAAAAALAQTVIWVSMNTWTFNMNYQHIRRLDWLIVLACATLAMIGTISRPSTPPMRTHRNSFAIFLSLTLVTITFVAATWTSARWSPDQRMPSAFSIEPVTPLFGVDVAFQLAPIGEGGPQLISDARFVAFDESGRLVPAEMQVVPEGGDGVSVLLVLLQPGTQPLLCRPGRAAKVTVQDEVSGVHVQALIPEGWCVV